MIGRVRALAVLLAAVAVLTIATAASGQDADLRRPGSPAPTAPPMTIPDGIDPSPADGAHEDGGSAAAAGAVPVAGPSSPAVHPTAAPDVTPTAVPATTAPSAPPTGTASATTTAPTTSVTPTVTSSFPATSTATATATATATTTATPTGDPTATPAERRVLLGASGPDRPTVEALDAALGRQVRGLRVYRRWGEPVVDGTAQWALESGRTLFLSLRAKYPDGTAIPFASIAGAAPGTPLYDDMARFAEQVRAVPGPIYLTFNHEPDADPENGSAADFVAAWRTWVGVLRAAGVTNARFVWTVTAFGFVRADDRAAPLYWPGDDVVDAIGVDGYNAYACLQPNGPWRNPSDVFGAAFGWAADRHPGVPVVLMEWSSVEDPAVPERKAQWIRDLAGLVADTPQVTAMLQWGGGGVLPDAPGCDYALATSQQSLSAWHDLGLLPLLSAAFVAAP